MDYFKPYLHNKDTGFMLAKDRDGNPYETDVRLPPSPDKMSMNKSRNTDKGQRKLNNNFWLIARRYSAKVKRFIEVNELLFRQMILDIQDNTEYADSLRAGFQATYSVIFDEDEKRPYFRSNMPLMVNYLKLVPFLNIFEEFCQDKYEETGLRDAQRVQERNDARDRNVRTVTLSPEPSKGANRKAEPTKTKEKVETNTQAEIVQNICQNFFKKIEESSFKEAKVTLENDNLKADLSVYQLKYEEYKEKFIIEEKKNTKAQDKIETLKMALKENKAINKRKRKLISSSKSRKSRKQSSSSSSTSGEEEPAKKPKKESSSSSSTSGEENTEDPCPVEKLEKAPAEKEA